MEPEFMPFPPSPGRPARRPDRPKHTPARPGFTMPGRRGGALRARPRPIPRPVPRPVPRPAAGPTPGPGSGLGDLLLDGAEDAAAPGVQHLDPDPVAETHEGRAGLAVAQGLDRAQLGEAA